MDRQRIRARLPLRPTLRQSGASSILGIGGRAVLALVKRGECFGDTQQGHCHWKNDHSPRRGRERASDYQSHEEAKPGGKRSDAQAPRDNASFGFWEQSQRNGLLHCRTLPVVVRIDQGLAGHPVTVETAAESVLQE